MRKPLLTALLGLGLCAHAFAQERTIVLDTLQIRGTRIDGTIPMTFTDLRAEDLRKVNLGKDIPLLIQRTPSVVSTSDAGMGIGYTGLRIRGVDDTRINVTINGIPLNDAESHGVFWVNLPDLASSVGNLQIQRGVGSSVNGPAAFGASVNLRTAPPALEPHGRLTTAAGAFGTRRLTAQAGTGRFGAGWSIDGRLSRIASDGFIDRASSDLASGFLTINRQTDAGLWSAQLISGSETTYQAWNGVPEARLRGDQAGMNHYADQHFLSPAARAHLLASGNRTYNAYTYDNQVDRYRQDHYQLHHWRNLAPGWTLHAALHATRGRGYYEEFKEAEAGRNYDPAIPADQESDLIRRRWLDNTFAGFVSHIRYGSGAWSTEIGVAANRYVGDHFGEVIWARGLPALDKNHRYYDNTGRKRDASVFLRTVRTAGPWSTYADLQLRRIEYEFLGKDHDGSDLAQTDVLRFVNPKVGITYTLAGGGRAYASYAVGRKEPTRNDYVDSTPGSRPRPETLHDVEMGYRWEHPRGYLGANLYAMRYRDQLILTGQVNDVGAYTRTNVRESRRRGIELEAGYAITARWSTTANATFSRSSMPTFTEYLDDYDNGGQAAFTYRDTDLAFAPRFVGALGTAYEGDRFRLGLHAKAVSRQYLDNASARSRSIDPYAVFELEAGWKLTTNARIDLTIYNLMDAVYETNGYTYGWIGGGEQRFDFYYPQAGRHGILQLTVEL